jgi:GntP family gluconate:H+ symporter
VTGTVAVLADAPALTAPVAPGWQLILAFLAGIAVIVVLITVVKLHPFLALMFGGLTVGLTAGESLSKDLKSFTDGFGSTAASVGILIALGAMFAKLLADSGGADQIVDTIVSHSSPRMLPWAMALVGAIIGLPMFFEIGLVLLMPVIYLVARRSGLSLITVGIPALAGLSAMHGFVPPHPGPVTAVGLLNADLGLTLGLGVLVAIPTIIVAGPLFGKLAGKWVPVEAPDTFDADRFAEGDHRRPSFGITLFTVLLPMFLMLGKAIVDIVVKNQSHWFRIIFDSVGTPIVALLVAVIVGMFTLGPGGGMSRGEIMKSVESGLPAVAGIFMIVATGGGFKQVLVDTGIGTLLAEWAKQVNISVIVLAWLIAVLIRLATGSATVATITAASLMLALVEGKSPADVSLVVLAVGAGSLFFSHVNDAGFWLVNQYFKLSVGQTIKTWSIMETILSVSGLIVVLLLDLVVG